MYQNRTADYSDGKIDAERLAAKAGVVAAVDAGHRLAVEGVDSAAYIGGFRVRAAQLARAAGCDVLDDWVGPGS